MTKVSVYVPSYNVAEFLPHCLEGLLNQTLAPDEILVIDDGSQDASAQIASSYSQVTVVAHSENRGLAAARNTALRSAKNELVASVDADCVPDPHWLETLVRNMDDEQVAGVGGRLIEGVRNSIADRWRCAHMLQEWGDARIENPLFLFGCNNIFRKSAVVGCGGYNEAMRTNGEDADISRRLRAQGWRLVYDPGAVSIHLRHDTVSSIMNAYWRWVFHGFESPNERLRLHKILRRAFFGNVWYMFGGLAKRDVHSKQFDLLLLDFALLFYFPQKEMRQWYKLFRGQNS